MQTFLPYPNFRASAQVLDPARLGKQRVETLQILRAIELPDYGWRNHPAVAMWRGRTPALVRYGLDCVQAWTALGHADSTAAQIGEFAPEVAERTQADLARAGQLPTWLGDERLHNSHRARLVAKDPAYYGPRFPGTAPDDEYWWPEPDDVIPDPPNRPVPAGHLWVLRPETEAALGRCVAQGLVGFGPATGLLADVAGHDLAMLRERLEPATRRPPRALRALAELISDVRTGDDIAVAVSGGRALLVGAVAGDYRFVRTDPAQLHHRRPVEWTEVVARSTVQPPAALQDVRPLFSVPWEPPR
ncbi:MAG: MSMEG_6728 family protein [bacterium]